jgi:hypothetical protein
MTRLLLVIAAVLASSWPGQVPSPANREASAGPVVRKINPDDRTVMSAVLDGIRPRRDHAIRLGYRPPLDPSIPTGGVFLVLDTTVPSCPRERPIGNRIVGCFDVRYYEVLLQRLACGQRSDAKLAQRNRSSLVIHGHLGKDVLLVPSSSMTNWAELSEIKRQHRHGSAVVGFSAPVYPRAGVAVIYYRMVNLGFGFVCLVRNGDRWSVLTEASMVE